MFFSLLSLSDRVNLIAPDEPHVLAVTAVDASDAEVKHCAGGALARVVSARHQLVRREEMSVVGIVELVFRFSEEA